MSGENIHRLEGGITTGGLVIRKKKGPDEDEDDPKNPSEAAATGATTPMRAPTASVLGLDRLAAVKREREAIAQRLREKESDIEEKNREGQELALNELFEPPLHPVYYLLPVSGKSLKFVDFLIVVQLPANQLYNNKKIEDLETFASD